MKKSYIALLYIGVILVVFGSFLLSAFTKNILYVLIVFGAFFVLSILCIPLYIYKVKKEYERQEKLSSEEVIKEINEKNENNHLQYVVHQIKAVIDTWRLSNKAEILKGFLFLGFFLGCIISCMVCFSLNKITLGIIFFSLGVGEILCSFIVVKLFETRAMHFKKDAKLKDKVAVVMGTAISSQSSMGKRHYSIGKTTYKVFLKIENKKMISYSNSYYETGDKLKVKVNEKKPKKIYIVGKIEENY